MFKGWRNFEIGFLKLSRKKWLINHPKNISKFILSKIFVKKSEIQNILQRLSEDETVNSNTNFITNYNSHEKHKKHEKKENYLKYKSIEMIRGVLSNFLSNRNAAKHRTNCGNIISDIL